MISFCSLSIKNSICVKELSLGAPADVTDKCPGCGLPPRGGHKEAAILSRLMSYGADLAQNTDPMFHIPFVCLCIAQQSMSGTAKDDCLLRLESEYAWSKMGPVETR